MREWLSGGVSPCQGEGRGFESRLALDKKDGYGVTIFFIAVSPAAHVLTLVNGIFLQVFFNFPFFTFS